MKPSSSSEDISSSSGKPTLRASDRSPTGTHSTLGLRPNRCASGENLSPEPKVAEISTTGVWEKSSGTNRLPIETGANRKLRRLSPSTHKTSPWSGACILRKASRRVSESFTAWAAKALSLALMLALALATASDVPAKTSARSTGIGLILPVI